MTANSLSQHEAFVAPSNLHEQKFHPFIAGALLKGPFTDFQPQSHHSRVGESKSKSTQIRHIKSI